MTDAVIIDGCGDYRTKEETKNESFATASVVFWFSSMKKLLMVLLEAGGAFIGYHYVVSDGSGGGLQVVLRGDPSR